jgi:cell division protein FtsI (penicillin-binding protein 3)
VVEKGTGTKAILPGYTSAGKTGTAQRKDDAACEAARNHVPGAKCRYSKTDYVGSFAGFAPLNNPAVVIVVILDSAKGLHQGGQVSAPVFARIAQQTLAYLNVPHDIDVPMSKRLLQAMKSGKGDLNDAPDAVGDPLEVAQDEAATVLPAPAGGNSAWPVDVVQRVETPLPAPTPATQAQTATSGPLVPPAPRPAPANGVVVGTGNEVVVPSFVGKRMREAVAEAQSLGLELDLQGSGMVREQLPVAGSRVQPGSHVAVRLAR